MENIKNYYLQLMNKEEHVHLTAEQAAMVLSAWNKGEKFIVVNGSAYATHQIIAIEKVNQQEEYDLLESKGLIPQYKLGEPSEEFKQKRNELFKQFEEKLNIQGFPKLSKEGGRYAPELLN